MNEAPKTPVWNEDGTITWVTDKQRAKLIEQDLKRQRRAYEKQYGRPMPE